jgi:hypothetical protein
MENMEKAMIRQLATRALMMLIAKSLYFRTVRETQAKKGNSARFRIVTFEQGVWTPADMAYRIPLLV